MSTPFLAGLALSGFRSFGDPELQRIGPMTKVHLLAGPNNSGKSNVLEVAVRGLPALRNRTEMELGGIDAPITGTAESRQFRIGVLLPVADQELEEIIGHELQPDPKAFRDFLFGGPTFVSDRTDAFWLEFTANEGTQPAWAITENQISDLGSQLPDERGVRMRQLSKQIAQQWSNDAENNARQVLESLIQRLDLSSRVPPVARIGPFRRITASESDDVIEGDHDGAGLIARLARLQNPSIDEPENRERFIKINRFVQRLFDDSEAEIDVPHDRKTLLVRYNNEWLPLENYGTGLHEVVVLAAASTVLSGNLVCIEEPEIHLHPTLQRKLLRYLAEETDNQYLIATHSAHLLDSEQASLSAVRLTEGNTIVETALEPKEVAVISSELGARASDLVQANCVIWVEGPSDRTYIRHWIERLAPNFVEGVHYSLLFYGGRLLTHLSADDPAIDEFISLPRINRNFTIVIDSDRKKSGARIGKTKLRLKNEIASISGHEPWITQGYTIENYVPPDLLKQAVAEVHPGVKCVWNGDRYRDPLSKGQIRGRKSPVDKPAVAERVIASWDAVNPWPLDLSSQVKSLIDLVQSANS